MENWSRAINWRVPVMNYLKIAMLQECLLAFRGKKWKRKLNPTSGNTYRRQRVNSIKFDIFFIFWYVWSHTNFNGIDAALFVKLNKNKIIYPYLHSSVLAHWMMLIEVGCNITVLKKIIRPPLIFVSQFHVSQYSVVI